jgi:hypothetical protein
VTVPNVICVLGMHRSGTSLIARIVNLLGVSLGPESDIVQAAPDNPRGFWEHPRFRILNDELLARLGVSWDTVATLPAGWQDDRSLDDLRDQARRAIEMFAGEAMWGWKDPRTCVTLPFWQPLTPPLRYIICLRSVLDVARSLEHRDALPVQTGARLWVHYTAAAFQSTSGAPRVCVFYEDLLTDPGGQAARLSRFINGDDHRAAVPLDEIRQAVDLDLHHHRSSLVDVVRDPALPDAAKSLFVMLRTHAPEALASGANGFHGIVGSLREIAGEPAPATTIDDLRSEAERLNRTLEDRTRELGERVGELAERTRELEDRKRELEDHKRELAERAGELADRTRALEDRDRQLEDRNRELAEHARDLAERGRELEQRLHEIAELAARCDGYDERLTALTAEFRALSTAHQAALATTQELVTQLQTIYNSRAWRWLTRYRRMRRRIDRREWDSRAVTKRT